MREARAALGPTGADRRDLSRQPAPRDGGGEAGADYVAFGAFYPTTTKPSDYRPDPSILSWWSSYVRNSMRRDRRDYSRRMPVR